MKEELLKKEWQEFVEKQMWQGEDDYTKNMGVGNVADWWLEKIHQAEQVMMKKIEEWEPIQWDEQSLAEMKQDLKELLLNN